MNRGRCGAVKLAFSNLYDGEHRDDTLSELPLEKAVFC